MATSKRSFIIPRDTFEAGREGWAGSEGGAPQTYRPKADKPVIVRFLSNPLNPPVEITEDGDTIPVDWVPYREVGAFDGLLGGLEMKGGPYEFPVYDIVVNEFGQRMNAPRGTDLLFDSVLPKPRDAKDGRTRAKASDMVAFNAICVGGEWGSKKSDFDPKPGQHIVMKLSGAKARQLLEQLLSKVEEDEDLDPTSGAWQIMLKGADQSQTLILTRKTKGIPVLDYEPELINVIEHLNAIRDAAETKWELLKNTSIDIDEDFNDDDEDDVDAFEEAAAATTDYSVMSPARLRKLLTDANVEIPPRATTAALIKLATDNL